MFHQHLHMRQAEVLRLLQEGGYILYVRHAEATVGEDQHYLSFQDCRTQRNLSQKGRRQAVMYGQTLRRLRVPVEYPVLTSPFCRNIETAVLAFGAENVQIDPFWVDIYRLSGQLSEMEQRRILTYFQSVIETPVPQGWNKIIISHSFPQGVGLGQIPNIGTVVVKPRGRGNGYEVVARASLTDFQNMND